MKRLAAFPISMAFLTAFAAAFLATPLVFGQGLGSGEGGQEPQRGLEVAVGVGYGIPFGGFGETTVFNTTMSLDYWITGEVPASLDLGYRINRRFVVGLFGQFGVGFVNESHTIPCDEGVTCSASVSIIGGGLIWNVLPGAFAAPWVGLGAGTEWSTITQSGRIQTSATNRGPVYAVLRGGADFMVAHGLRVGPFFSLSVGRYETETLGGEVATNAQPTFTVTQLHEWLVFGARGSYDIGF
jgi:hypothetical protein